MEGLFHPLSFCLVYLDNDAKQTQNEAGDMATIYATIPTRKSPGYPDITLCPGSQGFPNSENPTLQCTRTWNLTKGIHCTFLKLGPIHSHLQYNTHNQPDKPQKQWSSMKKSDVLPSAQCAPRTVLSRGHPPPSGRKASWNTASRCQTRNKARRVHAPPSNTPSS